MSLLPVTNTFEGGTDTTQTSAANTGGASGTAFDSVVNGAGVTRTFSSTQKRGTLSMKTVQPATGVTDYGFWSGWGANTVNVYTRCYIFVSTVSVTNQFLAWRNNATSANCANAGITSAGKFAMYNAGGATAVLTSTLTMTINTWYRVECRVLPSTTVGVLEYRLFTGANLEGTVPDETKVSAASSVLAADIAGCRVGHGCSSGFAFSGGTGEIDDVSVTTVDWLGSSLVTTTVPLPNVVDTAVARSASW